MQNEYEKNLRNSNQRGSQAFSKIALCKRCGNGVDDMEIERLEHYIECGKTYQNPEELFKERREPKASDGIFYFDE